MSSAQFASTSAAGAATFVSETGLPTPSPSMYMQQSPYYPSPAQYQQLPPQSFGTSNGLPPAPTQNGFGAAHVNGHDSGHAPSEQYDGSRAAAHPMPDHAIKVINHAYTVGFQSGSFSDVELLIRERPYRLTRLILARSPFWASHLDIPPGMKVVVQMFDDTITDEAIAIALGHLYSSHVNDLITPENSKSCLAAAQFFGLPDLAAIAYDVCKTSINYNSIGQWIEWCEASTSSPNQSQGGPQGQGILQAVVSVFPPSQGPGQGQGYDGPGGMYGTVNGGGQRPFSPAPSDHRGMMGSPAGRPVYAPEEDVTGAGWKSQLRADVHTYITQTLPTELEANPHELTTPLSSDPRYIQIFTLLPFDLFRACIEDPKLKVGGESQQARFSFAKSVIAKRKKRAAQILAANPGMTPAPVENVVLQIGGNGHQVHITRKSRVRTLWKVEKE